MHSRFTGSLPRLAALAGTVAVLAACSSGGGTPPQGSSASTGTSHLLSATTTIRLAAANAQRVTSVKATVAITVTQSGGAGTVQMAGTMAEQLSPTLLVEANFDTFEASGVSIPGGISEVLTTKAAYLKMSTIMQTLHTTKPWVEIPLSVIDKTAGMNLSSLFSQAQTSNPLAQAQMLTASPDVHKVGTGTVNGVPVTEYAGSYSMAKALASLPAASRGAMSAQIESLGIKSAKFHVWIDDQHQVRKLTGTLTSSKITETMSETITSVNQPVNITPPTPAQTYVITASMLNIPAS